MIEALIALIMFTVIMASLSFAFTTVMRAQTASEAHQDDNGSVRVVFDALKRDIQASYASNTDPASVFIGNASPSGTGSNVVSSPGLLTLSTCSYNMKADELNNNDSVPGTNSIGNSQTNSIPQACFQIVRYDFDSNSGQLVRSVTAVPNLQLVNSPGAGDPSTIIGTGISNISFQYWDPTQNQWSDTWDFEQSNMASNTGTGSTGTGASAAAANSSTSQASSTGSATSNSSSASSSSSTPQFTTFPSAVQVTIQRLDRFGKPMTYTTIIPITAYQPYTDPSTQGGAGAGAAGGTGTGGGGTGGAGTGGTGTGGTGTGGGARTGAGG